MGLLVCISALSGAGLHEQMHGVGRTVHQETCAITRPLGTRPKAAPEAQARLDDESLVLGLSGQAHVTGQMYILKGAEPKGQSR